jgi:carbamoyltransferase
MSNILGIAGASRNAALALCSAGRIVGVCEQERVSRTRRAALPPGRLPREALDTILNLGACAEGDISTYAVAEAAIQLPPEHHVEHLDHHHAHAAAAFYSSAFTDAEILICDRHRFPELTVWRADETGIRQEDFPWVGPGFATVYSQTAEAFGFRGNGDEHRLEALARVGASRSSSAAPAFAYRGDHLDIPHTFQAAIASVVGRNGSTASVEERASLANDLQRQLGGLLLQVVADIKRRFGGRNLCLGGGLFYNSYFVTLIAESGIYDRVFVPPNPGNAGVAVGASCAVAASGARLVRDGALSPFLGPEFGPGEIKATLDNCKVSYDYLRDGQRIDRTTHALATGKLVGWFQGRMEWGSRALGHRSILASPVAPYVLENLNVFLKQREPYRTYSVSVCLEDLPRYFRGPAASPMMEYEYEVVDRDLLARLLPLRATRLRVQTVDAAAGLFYQLIRAFGDLTGVPMLVNTSFNGFNEPIVCSPRDAVRVFYGTGLDMAVLDSLVLVK